MSDCAFKISQRAHEYYIIPPCLQPWRTICDCIWTLGLIYQRLRCFLEASCAHPWYASLHSNREVAQAHAHNTWCIIYVLEAQPKLLYFVWSPPWHLYLSKSSVVPRVPTKTIFTSQAGPDTNGSQFFITTAAAHHLDGMETQAALKENMTVSPCITHMMVNHW